MSERPDLVVVGAGLLGLATAREYLVRHPGDHVMVLDKEPRLAMHQSGRNSGVLHTGLYYQPASLKARLCREGRAQLLVFADQHGIPYRLSGKLVVARDESELGRLAELARRGRANGIVGLREVAKDELREIEPNVRGVRGLHVPESGVIDFRVVTDAYASDVERLGGVIKLGAEVRSISKGRDGRLVRVGDIEITTRRVAVCGGVHSDRLARLTGPDDGRYRMAPFRGDYFVLSERATSLVNGLIYPVPDPAFPFLGVHFTCRMDGQVWAGPNAVPSFDREGYRRAAFRPRDAGSLLAYPGMWRLARSYYRTGAAEVWRDISKRAAVAEMRKYLPDLELSDIELGPSGIRAQVLERNGSLIDDFVFQRRDDDVLHVINAPSPAATASLAIAKFIVDEMRL